MSEAGEAGGPLITRPTETYRAIHALVWLAAHGLHRVRIEGRENLPREGGILLAANHQSFADIPLIAAVVPRQRRKTMVAIGNRYHWRSCGPMPPIPKCDG